MQCREHRGLLLISKPWGIATHSPGDGKPGLAEELGKRLGKKLLVCHRLDAETSGALVFALTHEAASTLAPLFERHQTEKQYLFVTDRDLPPQREITIRSHIKKFRGRFVSWVDHAESNAESRFELLRSEGKYSLWRAEPRSGKPHQIRLHAKNVGIPILGDSVHGGSRFPRLMLHAERLAFEWDGEQLVHEVAPSPLFKDLALLRDVERARFAAEVDHIAPEGLAACAI